MPTEVYLGLGANIGNKRLNIGRAASRLRELSIGLTMSSLYETKPVGAMVQPSYVNAVCRMWTRLSVFELLHEIREIQRSVDARGPVVNGPRALDIDILLCGSLIATLPHLILPHPRMTKREFVLRPLVEVAPNTAHPTTGKTAAELLADLVGAATPSPSLSLDRSSRSSARPHAASLDGPPHRRRKSPGGWHLR